MENQSAMKGGEGPNSYLRNSTIQEARNDRAKVLLTSSIEEALVLQKDTHIFTIADLGCSVGPNTFKCIANMIEAVQHKYTSEGHDLELPEFHVFFNDVISNDFNTLFKSLPPERQYMVAGVPGSFHGRVFPKSSMNLMHSATSLQWLSKVPKEVREEDSPLWNKGRISFARSSIQIMEAFGAQFTKDLEAFLLARSEELVPGGLMAILMPCRPEGTLPSEEYYIRIFEYLGEALNDMVKEGLVSESLLDSFNIPVFVPTVSEVNQVVSSTKYLQMEKLDKISFALKLDTPQAIEYFGIHIRAVLGDFLSKHFGSNIMDELFNRYLKKLQDFSNTLILEGLEEEDPKIEYLFMLVKLSDVSGSS